jgi:hypothetical protein
MVTMNNSQNHRNPSSYAPVTAVDDDDQFEHLNNLPLAQDVVKAIFAVVLMAIVMYGLPTWSNLWNQYTTEAETQSTSTTENSIATPPERSETQISQRSENRHRRNRMHAAPQVVQDDDVEIEIAQHCPVNIYNNTYSVDFNFGHQSESQPKTNVPDQRTEVRTFTYFDNAGRSYPTKGARDRGEEQCLAESLAAYPSMSSQQRDILRRRAFARLEQLDMEQRITFSP